MVDAAYRKMRSIERSLAGGEGIVGMYGSLTPQSMQSILNKMHLTPQSVLLDVGAGLARPLVHAVVGFGLRRTVGWELDPVKCMKADAMMSRLVQDGIVPPDAVPDIKCRDAGARTSLPDGTTHVFAFWEGIDADVRAAVGRLWRACPTAEYVAIAQHAIHPPTTPEEEMADLQFGPVTLLARVPVTQSGSRSGYTAYVFRKRRFGRNRDPRLGVLVNR